MTYVVHSIQAASTEYTPIFREKLFNVGSWVCGELMLTWFQFVYSIFAPENNIIRSGNAVDFRFQFRYEFNTLTHIIGK